MTSNHLEDLLLAAGLVDASQLHQGRHQQKATGHSLAQVLQDAGCFTEQQLIQLLQKELGLEFVDLTTGTIPVDMAQFLPQALAEQYHVVPVKLDRNGLCVAMSDPLDFDAQEQIRRACKMQVIPMLANRRAVHKAIATLYGNAGTARVIEEMKRQVRQDSQTQPFPNQDLEEAPTIRFVNGLIERAFLERASDIHLEPQQGEMVVRMRIDGQLRKILTVPADLQDTVVYRLKVMGGMNISQRRIPQDGHAQVTVGQHPVDLRINFIPTVYGEKMALRLLDKSSRPIDKTTLGLTDRELGCYDDLLSNASGMILIVGPTGSGKSTTMYAMLRQLAREEVHVVSLEDPVEYHIQGVNQCPINEKAGMTFSAGLRAILRQDPDIISVGEIRDAETAAIAARAAITGHLVLSTLHTNDAVLAVDRLKDIGVEPYLIASSLRGILSQRLVRRICPHCRRSYRPDSRELVMADLPEDADVLFYRGQGCPACGHTGYYGRVAVFEIFMITKRIRHLIQSGAAYEALLQAALEEGMVPMAQNCKQLVLDGVTTVQETARAVHSTL